MIAVLEKIVEDIRNGKNIENYIIIALALIIFILDIFGFDGQELISEITLAVLALIAFGRIVDAQKIESIDRKISLVSQSRFLKEFPETLVEDMRSTPELWIVGITLSRTINTHFTLFKRKLEQGASIKILLAKPESAATEIAAFRDRRPRLQDHYDNAVKSTLNDLCRIGDETGGSIELKTINVAFSFGYYAMAPNTSNGKIYLEHYAFKSEDGDIPKMFLTQLDGYIYEAFVNQLNNLWEHASVWDCSSTSQN